MEKHVLINKEVQRCKQNNARLHKQEEDQYCLIADGEGMYDQPELLTMITYWSSPIELGLRKAKTTALKNVCKWSKLNEYMRLLNHVHQHGMKQSKKKSLAHQAWTTKTRVSTYITVNDLIAELIVKALQNRAVHCNHIYRIQLPYVGHKCHTMSLLSSKLLIWPQCSQMP